MFKLTGVVFIVFGIIVLIFFTQSNGSLAPYPLLMHVLGIALIPTGLGMIIFNYRKNSGRNRNSPFGSHQYLKESGEKIIVSLDDCEFKSNDYEIEMPDLQTQYDAFEGPEHGTHIENILQTMVIYNSKTRLGIETFQSPVFPLDIISLKTHIMKQELILYIDRKDRSNYCFELTGSNVHAP